jgi:hypothetical protein
MKHEKNQAVIANDEPDAADISEIVLLPLDEPRSVSLTVKNAGTFVYRFRRIGLTDWLKYYEEIVNRVVNSSGFREEIFEAESSLMSLVNTTLMAVEGYGDTAKVKNWIDKLPLHHRLAAGSALRSVGVGTGAESASRLSDAIEVSLNAAWGIKDGKTVFYSGLIHRFRHPSILDLRKFNFESANTRVNAETMTTDYPSRQAIAMKIYDDLIESVDGYSVFGRPLEGVENIKREMDGAHKAAAALEIFTLRKSIAIE